MNKGELIMPDIYHKLKNEYDDGASKSMIDFTDIYLESVDYNDIFTDFLTYLHVEEGRLSEYDYQQLMERAQKEYV